ncbi:MAG: type II toxin-antitoxin system RelE/ParE family toxin [Rickettsiales bacterium]|jgi:toxin ParE1/3/4|nr:type II toxin-antitoxin system RelE/ParE family toxin [Rickettsiales bacterium]
MSPKLTLRLTSQAKADLQSIWRYTIETWSNDQANRYVDSIKQACLQLMHHPALGRRLIEIDPGLRVYRLQHHFIFYLEDRSGVIFIAFLHERMDIVNRLIHRLEQP